MPIAGRCLFAAPPELSAYAGDWPTPRDNLAGHRAAARTPIGAHNVDRLEVAWRFPLAASSGYGAVTATPIVAGETVYRQDMESNVFALDLASGGTRWTRLYQAPTGPSKRAPGSTPAQRSPAIRSWLRPVGRWQRRSLRLRPRGTS